jgi:hypothetical protein
MFPVTVTISNATQLNAVMAALNVEQIIDTPKPAPAESKKEKAKATVVANGASSTAADPSPTPAAAAQDPAPTAVDAAPGAASVTYDDVKTMIGKLGAGKSRQAVIDLLAEFGVAKGPDLKPEQFAGFVAKANAQLAA